MVIEMLLDKSNEMAGQSVVFIDNNAEHHTLQYADLKSHRQTRVDPGLP